MSGCKSWMKYSWDGVHCENPPWELDTEGLCILHSLKPEKDKSAFDLALQDKLAREDYDFREVFFPGQTSFTKQTFKKPVTFHRARFAGWADFREAEYIEGADFSWAKFGKEALFEKAKFGGPVQFKGTEIAGEADFRGVFFGGPAIFQQLNESLTVSGALPFTASFQYLEFGPQGHLSFQDLSLAWVSFLGADLRRIQFHNVSWHPFHGRQAVYDEILLNKKQEPHLISLTSGEHSPDYGRLCAKIEELYRYLKLNYEHEGDQKQAGDFHYGEMEMHRRANPWQRWFPFSWYNLYRVLSGYGERPLRAVGWLVALVMGSAFLLQHLGLKTHDGSWTSFGEAVVYVLEVSTLLRPEWPKPSTHGGHFVSALSHFLVPGQAALFLLAIRNRLGRRH
jgi:uncharacterized protein YjbI with pentapeptide repeats